MTEEERKAQEQEERDRLEQERLAKEGKSAYTKDELQKLIQSEADKRVTDALKTREEALRKELDDKYNKERKESERLAQLSADEKEKELLAKGKKDLDDREAKLRHKELLSDTKDVLYEAKLPVTFADTLVAADAESTQANIKAFKDAWEKALAAAVNDALKGKVPGTGKTATGTPDADAFKKLTYAEKAKLKKDNPEAYAKLVGREGVK